MKIGQKKSFFILFFLIGKFLFAQFDIPKIPPIIYPINDYAKVLSDSQVKNLSEKLFIYNKQTSSEILIVLLKNLKGEDPNLLATNWGEKWKIGKKGKDNGMVILISTEDKKIAIQNGYGLEAYFTDALSKRVIENYFRPYLEKQEYYQAIDQGTDEIFRILKDIYKNSEKPIQRESSWIGGVIFLILILILIFVFSGGSKGGKNNFRKNFAELFFQILILLATSGRGGGRSNSSEGRGFGGGGRFGGGGASSGW